MIESSKTVELSGDIHLLKTKLSPHLNSEKEYNLLSKEFYGRRWLEDYIEDWQDRKSAKVLIVYGKPGSGKSAFSVNYSHYNSDVYGCFLCEWNREYTITPNRFIKTMAFRLATKLPDYRSMLLHQLEEDVCLEEMNDEALFDFLLVYPLSHLVDGNRETSIIVVDGLDEAESGGDNPLAAVFAKCVERLPRWIKFVFTSRPERNVSKYFQACESIDITDDMPEGYNDIIAYFIKSLTAELHQTSNKLETLKSICDLSDGIFLYAELLVNDVKNGFIKLSDVSRFPKGLNAFYRMSMERKFTSKESFHNMRAILELLSISDTMPEELLRNACGYTRYSYLTYLDKLGSWVNRYEENGLHWLGFSHKSVRDWFTNREQSGDFYIDYKSGALRLARYCREYIENDFEFTDSANYDGTIREFIRNHVGAYYIVSEHFKELEDFLLSHKSDLDPYWTVWSQFPQSWDNTALLDGFWTSVSRNAFLKKLQREGNTAFLLWIFDIAKDKYGIKDFDKELISVYMDIVHLSGEYSKAVEIADQYLNGHAADIAQDEFLAMLSVRKIHHLMFYKPAGKLLEDAMSLSVQLNDRFPVVYNELLFLIGGNLGVLHGDWKLSKTWLDKSIAFAEKHFLKDFNKRNARKVADYYCCLGQFEQAEKLLKDNIPDNGKITGRYEAYLVGALANVYTCISNDDEAMERYEQVLKYTTAKGINGWSAHANLGIANINFKLGNLKEAADSAMRANSIYNRIHQEWGIIMSEALLAACESRMGIAPIRVSCNKAIKHAEKMQYGSCVSSIEELCSGSNNFLKLYFI